MIIPIPAASPIVIGIIILEVAVLDISSVLMMTEIMSNTATSNMIIPITIELAAGIGLEPYGLMATVALAASCAFMLPISTPPNAAVFSSDLLNIETMAKAGIWMNIVSVIVIVLAVYFFQPL